MCKDLVNLGQGHSYTYTAHTCAYTRAHVTIDSNQHITHTQRLPLHVATPLCNNMPSSQCMQRTILWRCQREAVGAGWRTVLVDVAVKGRSVQCHPQSYTHTYTHAYMHENAQADSVRTLRVCRRCGYSVQGSVGTGWHGLATRRRGCQCLAHTTSCNHRYSRR